MTDPSNDRPPFDEGKALVELERFRQEIERHRIRRQIVAQEFDAFTETMPPPELVFPTEQASAEAPPNVVPPVATRANVRVDTDAIPARPPLPVPPVQTTRPAIEVPASVHRKDDVPLRQDEAVVEPRATVPAPRKGRMLPVILTIGVLTAIGGFAIATSMFRSGEPQSPPQQSAPASSQATPAPRPPAQSNPAPQPPAPQPRDESEIVTVRRAWVRVIADGERVVERELPADSRIPFKAEKTIVIRTGDAGAVKLSIRGQDQGTLGKDGAVITRTFTVPAATGR
jgi:hypothetical protein